METGSLPPSFFCAGDTAAGQGADIVLMDLFARRMTLHHRFPQTNADQEFGREHTRLNPPKQGKFCHGFDEADLIN
jgi:hypothetical protein